MDEIKAGDRVTITDLIVQYVDQKAGWANVIHPSGAYPSFVVPLLTLTPKPQPK